MGVLVGKKAPDFTASAVEKGQIIENFKLSDYSGQYIVLFFYPLDRRTIRHYGMRAEQTCRLTSSRHQV